MRLNSSALNVAALNAGGVQSSSAAISAASSQVQGAACALVATVSCSCVSSQAQSTVAVNERQVSCSVSTGQAQSQSGNAGKSVSLVSASSQAQGTAAAAQGNNSIQSSQAQSSTSSTTREMTCSVSTSQVQCVRPLWVGDPYWDSVVFAAHFDSDYSDLKGHAVTGIQRVALDVGQFGSGVAPASSFYNAIYVRYAPSSDFNLGSGNFTADLWEKTYGWNINSTIATFGPVNLRLSGSTTLNVDLHFADTSTVTMTVADCLYGVSFEHIAVVRNGTTFTVYKGGISIATLTGESREMFWDTSTAVSVIGNQDYGIIDDVRLTKVARYTSNFAVPTAAFPDDAGGGTAFERSVPLSTATQQVQSASGAAQRNVSLASESSGSQSVAGLIVEVHFCGTSTSQAQLGASTLLRGVSASSVTAQAQASASAYIRSLNAFATAYQAQSVAGQTQRNFAGGATHTSQSQSAILASWMGSSHISDFFALVPAAIRSATVLVTLNSVIVPPEEYKSSLQEQQFEVTV